MGFACEAEELEREKGKPRRFHTMEESSEVHSEENKVLPEKNKKRRLKTPAQVEALEKFYNEHKYPTESLKLELAEKIGLTEKQVSGWFCHRRLKDKKLLQEEAHANGRQDRSSGVIQDRGSGLRQDSCGSIKQGDYRLVDPKEVESRRFYGEDILAADLTYEHRRHYTGNLSGTDTSSGSSSPLQDRFFAQSEDHCDMEASRSLTQYGSTMPINAKVVKSRGYIGPSGYLKVKGEVENAAITAVKRQLGRHYQEDGPPLGVEFQPLPPGAFESPITDPINAESYHVGNPILPHSSDVPGVRKQPNLSTRYEGYSSKMSCLDSYMEGGDIKTMHGSDHPDDHSHHQSKQKSYLPNYSNPFPGRNSSVDMNEDSVGDISIYSCSRNGRMRSKQGAEGMRLDSVSNYCLHPYDGKVTSEQTEPWSYNYDDDSPKIVPRREHYDSKPSNLILRRSESLDPEEKGPSRRMVKEEELYGKKREMKKRCDPVGVKLHLTSEMRVAKRVRDDFPQRDYMTKMPFLEMPQQKNYIKGSAVDMPSSFSEDETAETSSSMD